MPATLSPQKNAPNVPSLPARTTRRDSPHRWTREEYHKMIAAGVFNDTRVELLDGEIWNMAGQLTPHATAVRKTTAALRDIFGEDAVVDMQLPIAATKWSEPEPDVTVVRGTPDDYDDHHPSPEEVLLLVEVSDTSLRRDRGKKAKSYARAGITDYWIVNLGEQQLEVHRQPTPEGLYLDITVYTTADSAEPIAAPGELIRVADLLPAVKQKTE